MVDDGEGGGRHGSECSPIQLPDQLPVNVTGGKRANTNTNRAWPATGTATGRMEVTTPGNGPMARDAMQCDDEPTKRVGVPAT